MSQRIKISSETTLCDFNENFICKTKFSLEIRVFYKSCLHKTKYKWIKVCTTEPKSTQGGSIDKNEYHKVCVELLDIYDKIRKEKVKKRKNGLEQK